MGELTNVYEKMDSEARQRYRLSDVIKIHDEDPELSNDEYMQSLMATEPMPEKPRQKKKQTAEKKSQEILIPSIKCLGDIQSEEVDWLWEPYIPKGKITLLEGDPNDGKTFFALAVASIVSRGWGFPEIDGMPSERKEPGSVLYLTAEDGLADTIRPRIDMLRGDAYRIHVLDGFFYEGDEESIHAVTLNNINVIKTSIEDIKPSLIVVDPLQAYMGAGVDIHRANEVRPVLSRIAKLAEEYKVALLLIRHLSKARTDRALYRGNGSIDFTAAARSVLLVGKDPDQPEKRAIVQIKNSVAQIGDSIGFSIDRNGFNWTGASDLTADKLLGPKTAEDNGEKSAVDEAKEFLEDILQDGPVSSGEIKSASKNACISWRTIERAKETLNIKAFKEPGRAGVWKWRLPSQLDLESPSTNTFGGVGGILGGLDTPDLNKVRQDRQSNCIGGDSLKNNGQENIDLWADISKEIR